jgi:hypothetical protein
METLPAEIIERKIFLIRGKKVMLDVTLAQLYEVETRILMQAVKRNSKRFPEDFIFQLTDEEGENLRSQIVISSLGHGGRRYLPYVFTEHGVAMLSAVLKSQKAIEMSVFIIRSFVRLREMLATHKDLAYKMEELEKEQKEHGKQITEIYSFLKQLIEKPPEPKKRIGFDTSDL